MEKGALETRNPRGHPDDRTVATQRGRFPGRSSVIKVRPDPSDDEFLELAKAVHGLFGGGV